MIRSKLFKKILLGLLFLVNFWVWYILILRQDQGLLRVYFLDVGQGDAILIITPNGKEVLVDGGPNNKILAELNKILPFYDRNLDAVFLTHSDSDHLAGLLSIAENYKINSVFVSSFTDRTELYEQWEEILSKDDGNVTKIKAGDILYVDGIRFEILAPDLKDFADKKNNNKSLVIRADFGKHSFLLTGDIEKRIEEKLANNVHIDSDILKAAHHGSKTSSAQKFLDKVSPLVAVISSGVNNSYGHPHQEVLERLARLSKIKRTDIEETIYMKSDGEKMIIY